jgi:putative transposase
MTGSFQSISHSRWDCKYHVVFLPKRRRKAMFGNLRQYLGAIFDELAWQKECQIIEGHLMPDHVHMCLSIPAKSAVAAVAAVAAVVGLITGTSAIAIARQFTGRERNFTGEHFWARRYCVSTVGYEEDQVRAYIGEQEGSDGEGRF